ncbi:PaaI family thioesterase [Actinoallomurus rhizosphaericola]|uniref:PaaI family thioesterase n=1 Tax=Actinoallomurus rhizosphaericola TaxID=2952536 RepID=UPI0020900216|nr:PaaI family thioesterase [Actinoallomurus rhizosphaericola]MCO5992232.1 PaaI family thioesterase [Actinoallomurus rhizosphaericola]
MTGAWAAMQRVFEERDRQDVDEVRIAGLAELAARVRELSELVVLTRAGQDEVAAVAGEVEALTRRLTEAGRGVPPGAQVDEGGVVRQIGSPVTGELNVLAPPIEIGVLPDGTARSEFTLGVLYEGPPGFVHGGVSAMVLDHLSGVAASANGTPGMTAGLDLRYRRPTPLYVPLVAEAKAVRVDGRKTFVESRILGPDGQVTAEATAVFIMPTR